MSFFSPRPLVPVFTAILLLAAPAMAQQAVNARPPVDVLSATSLPDDASPMYDSEPTHPSLNLTPDRSEIVALDREAGTVIVGNPAHLSILLETNKNLVLVGKAPGATYFTVLDDEGRVVMQRHVIVAAPKEQYIRVRRSCAAAGGDNCQETSVFYCPDMCHNVSISTDAAQPAAQQDTQEALQDMTQATTGEAPDTAGPAAPEATQ